MLEAIKKLEKERNKISAKIYKIVEDEENKVQKPRCRNMVGWCLESEYSDNRYARILEAVEPLNGNFYFIMEEITLYDNGGAGITTNNHYPYLNKEWWNAEVPLSGWKKMSEEKYLKEKAKIITEMNTNSRMKKFLFENNKK